MFLITSILLLMTGNTLHESLCHDKDTGFSCLTKIYGSHGGNRHKHKQNVTIVLLGDSLIYKPSTNYHLLDKIQQILSNETANSSKMSVRLVNKGSNGQTIADIRKRTSDVLLRYRPNGIIMFWDSDVSNYDESEMTEDEILLKRSNYYANLMFVAKQILNSGSLLAISGPAVMGEGQSEVKTLMLNDYRAINKNISNILQIDYIDMRQAFLDDCQNCYPLYAYWKWYWYWNWIILLLRPRAYRVYYGIT